MSLPSVVVPPQPRAVSELLDPAAAFARKRSLIEAVKPEQRMTNKNDLAGVVARVLSAGPKLESLLPRAAATTMTEFTQQRLEHLRDLALALSHAHAVDMTGATVEGENLPALNESGVELRDRLMTDARYLVERGVLDRKRLEQVNIQKGYSHTAYALMALVSLLTESWAEVSTKSAVSEDDLAKAEVVARRILQALATRVQAEGELTETAVMRQNAYTLVFREYDAIRRMVAYLRWEEDDADDFAPSLMAIRRGSRRDRESAPPPPVAPEGTVNTPVSEPGKVAPASQEPKVPVGHQGGSPFTG